MAEIKEVPSQSENDHATANDPTFQNRVCMLSRKVAHSFAGEAEAGFTRIQWQKRARLTNLILQNDEQDWIQQISSGICAHGQLTIASQDHEIEGWIIADYDALAGVTGGDLLLQKSAA